MHKSYGHGSLTYRGCAALYGAVAYIAGGKQTRHVGFEEVGLAIERPVFDGLSNAAEIHPRKKITALVALNPRPFGPIGARSPSDANKEPACGEGLRFGGKAIHRCDRAQTGVAV